MARAMVSTIALASALTACGGARATTVLDPPAPPPTARARIAEPLALFPERPAFDAISPSRPHLFKQETWTEMTDGVQHCHEWAFDAADEAAVRDDANDTLASLGIVARVGGTMREDGLVLELNAIASDVLLGPDRALVRLTACTEGSALLETHRAFLAPIEARARAMIGDTRELGPLTVDLAWERRYADGLRRIGIRWRDLEPAVMRAWMMRHGYRESIAPSGAIDLVRGRERIRFLADVWWQSEIPAD